MLIGVSSVQEARRRVESQRQTVAAAAFGLPHHPQPLARRHRLDLGDAELALTFTKSDYLQAVYDY